MPHLDIPITPYVKFDKYCRGSTNEPMSQGVFEEPHKKEFEDYILKQVSHYLERLRISPRRALSIDHGTSSELHPLRHCRSEIIDPSSFSSAVQMYDSRKVTDLDFKLYVPGLPTS
ncbi:hypothetical protein TNCV_2139221 [Trichonephila clavipes]|uniref:Uncharacterized protein n=1 Tax=Trichonephila clavipes TaxID=2585209 RepID=A0A8X6RX42_TRICX|nr:hypothetical protein TNCV_2139221 [Trichonephila clavipes]